MATIYGTRFFWNGKYYDQFDDTLTGTSSNDAIYGFGGNDHIEGDGGDDWIEGGAGNDQIWGGVGHDRLWGGAGNDTIKPGFSANESIVGFFGYDDAHGGDGSDTLDFRNTTAYAYLYGDEGNDFIVGGRNDDYVEGGDGDDIIYGGWESSFQNLNGGDDLIFGDAGHDTVYAGMGNDHIEGGDDNDTLFGEGGNDFIDGGAGADFMAGGDGKDTFTFRAADAGHGTAPVVDTIWDFAVGQDRIEFATEVNAANYIEHQIGYNTGFEAAEAWATANISAAHNTAFVSDGVNGYLFHSTDAVNDVEIAIVVEDITNVNQFSHTDIV